MSIHSKVDFRLSKLLPSNILYLYVCLVVGSTCADIMADLNVPANDVPVEQAPAIAPPVRIDDQILPVNKWVPIDKSNCVLDVHKPQRNPIFLIVVALLKNTNFFRAFTASSTILAIHIQQFWDTMCFNLSTGLYSCQLDEQWVNLHKDILRDALNITLANDNNPFVAPPSSDIVIEYVNTLRYPSTLKNVSAMSVNALYQPWRAILSMINMCLIGKTIGFDRPRHPESLFNPYTSSSLTRKELSYRNLAERKRPLSSANPQMQRRREVFGRPYPDATSPDEITSATYNSKIPGHRHTPTTIKPSSHDESPLLYAELGLTDSETESDKEASPEINAGTQDEGQARPNPGEQDEGQAGLNPGIQDEGQAGSNHSDAARSQPQSSHVVHAGPNLEHMDFEENLKLPTKDQVILEEPASSARTLSSLQNLDKELSFTNQFLMEKPQEDEPDKSNTKAEVHVNVPRSLHQTTSFSSSNDHSGYRSHNVTISLHNGSSTTTNINNNCHNNHNNNISSTTSTFTTTKHPLEERLVKHGSRLYKLENLNIPYQVQKAVDEVVTDAVDWAMQAPLRARFSDLPTVDMKEILHQRMFKDNAYEAHEVYANLFDALEKSLERDHSDQLLSDMDEARRKKRKRRASGASGTSGASGSTQFPPPPPPPPTGASGLAQQQSKAPSLSIAMASTLESMAWTTSDTRYESTSVSTDQDSSPTESLMHDDSTLDKQVQSSNDEDTGNDKISEANIRKYWWKPLPKEKRPVTPGPAWTILPSSWSVFGYCHEDP
ncbi:hypothetical protein Tco_0448377 [Tanacetum coccineum]